MTWLLWLMAVDLAWGALVKVARVGTRGPLVTGLDACVVVVLTVIYIWAIVTLATN